MSYEPKPIPTDGVSLDPDLLALTERLAENTHDIWAKLKMDDGEAHASLVPYGELPESQKKYDRATVTETLKALVALGYRIEGPSTRSAGDGQPVPESAAGSRSLAAHASRASDPAGAVLPWDEAFLDEQTKVDAIRLRVQLFNADAAYLKKAHPERIHASKRDLLSEPEERELPERGKAILERYAIADGLAIRFASKKRATVLNLFVFAFFAMFAFEVAAHWPWTNQWTPFARFWLLTVYFIAWSAAFAGWYLAYRRDYQNRHQDYRALAEGLRVQFFWILLGEKEHVDEYYVGQHRDELGWVRYALRFWRAQDEKLFPADPAASSDNRDLVRRRWIQVQRLWLAETAKKEEHKEGRCRRDGWILFGLNVFFILVLLSLMARTFFTGPSSEEHVSGGVSEVAQDFILIIAGVTVVAAALRVAYGEKMAFSEHTKRYSAMLQRFDAAERELEKGASPEAYRNLGREALWESSHWLLIHRDRPLEVPLP